MLCPNGSLVLLRFVERLVTAGLSRGAGLAPRVSPEKVGELSSQASGTRQREGSSCKRITLIGIRCLV